jgi:hypothetical protein
LTERVLHEVPGPRFGHPGPEPVRSFLELVRRRDRGCGKRGSLLGRQTGPSSEVTSAMGPSGD